MTQSFKTRSLQRAFFELVPAMYALLKIRDEKVVGIYPEGKQIWINPLLDSFSLVFTGPSFPKYTIQTWSAEGVQLTFELSVAYRFDPLSAQDAEVSAKIARTDAELGRAQVLTLWIGKMVEDTLRHLVGRYRAINLCSGGSILELETRLRRCLCGEMKTQGILPISKNPITITQIRAPNEIAKSLLFAQTTQILKRNSSLSDEQVEHYIWVERLTQNILEHGGQVYVGSHLAQLSNTLGGLIEGLVGKSQTESTTALSTYSPTFHTLPGYRNGESGILYSATGD